jgi:hypothetical protein
MAAFLGASNRLEPARRLSLTPQFHDRRIFGTAGQSVSGFALVIGLIKHNPTIQIRSEQALPFFLYSV